MKRARDPAAWYRQPVLWLGAAIFAASLFACIATIVLATRHADTPLDGGRAMPKPPLERSAASEAR